jgi:hypothetical protein
MNFKKSIVSIGKTNHTVVQFNYTPPKDKNILKSRMHFIQILDRSGSMNSYIEELIENVKKTIHVMKPNDLLSIIWFSGPGQYKILLKGASAEDPALNNQLDKLKSTLGCTCFSEAMLEAKEIVEDLAELCDNFIVSLFTDGEPVVPWSVKEEELRTKKILAMFNDKILSFNTIGYGGSYNIKFLKELAALSMFGRHAHSTKIEEYLPIFKHNFRSVEGVSSEVINIKSEGNDILYLSRKNSRIDKDNVKTSLSKSINKFYIIGVDEKDFEFKINNEIFDSSKIKRQLTVSNINDLLYALAYERYYSGNAYDAIDILSLSLKDEYLFKSVLNAFTAKERQKYTDILLKAAHNRKIKTAAKGWIQTRLAEGMMKDNYNIESGPCFMDLLKIFQKNGDKYIPIPSEKYKRIGKKVIDDYNMFKVDKTVKVVAEFKDLVFSKEKLNISIRYEIPGYVTINPRQTKSVGFKDNNFKAKIFREQTIIKDGDINIEKFQALLSKETMNYLTELNIDGLMIPLDSPNYAYDNYGLVEINISKVPVLNRGYIYKSDSLDYILDIYYRQRVAECNQKVIKYFIEGCKKDAFYVPQNYTKEQYELLKAYGLDSSGIYHGIDNKIVKEMKDQYECKFFEFALKGFSTLPKVEDLLTKLSGGKKKLNEPETVMG